MLFRSVIIGAIALLAVSCSPQTETYVFRNDNRPSYTRTISAENLETLRAKGATIVDVRLQEDFSASPEMITGATYHDPEAIAQWATAIPKDKPVIVYCVKGKWVSQKAAHYLDEKGYDVYSLEGGINAWQAQ